MTYGKKTIEASSEDILGSGSGLMGWSLLPNTLQPFKIYCAPPTITSQLVLLLCQTVKIDPLGRVRVVEALQNFVQKCDPVIFSEVHIHIAGAQQFRVETPSAYGRSK